MTSQSVTTATDLRAMLERLRGLINTDLLTPWHASRTVAGMQLYAQGIANEILKRLLANSTLFSPAVPDQMQEVSAASVVLRNCE